MKKNRIAIPLAVPRFAAQYRHGRWVILDRHTGTETEAKSMRVATERASLCNGVWHLLIWKEDANYELSS